MFRKTNSSLKEWHDNLNPITKAYLKNQPIWRDSDLVKYSAISFIAGIIIGAIFVWH